MSADKLKKWDCKRAKCARDLVCKELAEHLSDAIMAPSTPSVTVQEALFQELLRRKPECKKWKKMVLQMLPNWFSAKATVLSKDEIKFYVEQKTGYDLESAVKYFEVNVFRRVIAMRLNPLRQARQFLYTRPGCKARSLSFRAMSFDRAFFEDVIGDGVPEVAPKAGTPEEERRVKWVREHQVLAKKFPEDSCCTWSTKTAELMFWAVMTQDKLRDLRKDAMQLRAGDKRASYGSMNEIATAKHWPSDVKKMEWPKLVLKAALLGYDEKWLHAQFAMWLENELLSSKLSEDEQAWDFKFMSRQDDFGLPNPKVIS